MMTKEYYKEEIEKDTPQRQAYVDGLKDFLEQKKSEAKKNRAKFISPKRYRKNPEKYRKVFMQTLGFPLTEKKTAAKLISKTKVTEDERVTVYRMQFSVFGKVKFYGIYLEQKNQAETTPFVLSLHGGGGTPEVCASMHLDSDVYHHLARRCVEKGASVFCPQLLLWDKNLYGNEYDRVDTDAKLRQLGGSITALETLFLSQTIDYFIEEEKINREKIGVVGLSYGGMYALCLAACDLRIKACCSSSWFNDRFQYSWADWSYFGAQNKFTDAEVAALICPRRLILCIGDKDCMFDSAKSKQEAEKTAEYYAEWKKQYEFIFYIYQADHEFDREDKGIEYLWEGLNNDE